MAKMVMNCRECIALFMEDRDAMKRPNGLPVRHSVIYLPMFSLVLVRSGNQASIPTLALSRLGYILTTPLTKRRGPDLFALTHNLR
jgi:hypothetical protein